MFGNVDCVLWWHIERVNLCWCVCNLEYFSTCGFTFIDVGAITTRLTSAESTPNNRKDSNEHFFTIDVIRRMLYFSTDVEHHTNNDILNKFTVAVEEASKPARLLLCLSIRY